MLYHKYCFVGPCYVGQLYIDVDKGIYKFEWENEENYTLGAKNYKKYMKLDTPETIQYWMSERIINRERPDANVWLNLVGLDVSMSDIELFIGTHGASCNDSFWFGDEKDNQFWFDHLK